MDTQGEIASRHFAFLVSESELDEIFERIRARDMPYWADPGLHKAGEINHWDDGRGVYFKDLKPLAWWQFMVTGADTFTRE